MIISHRLKYAYVHVPKTGGTSIKNVLMYNKMLSYDEKGYYKGQESPDQTVCKLFTHASINEVINYLIKSNKIPDEYFKFAFIRNPWDMMVSHYEYYKQYMSKLPYLDEVEARKIKAAQNSFEDFLNKFSVKWINDRILLNGVVGVDYLAKFENIQEDSQFIFKTILGTKYRPIQVPHNNKTIRKPYQEYYNDRLQKYIEEQFKDIIQLGNYVF